jgi:hypothetical protein
MRRNSSSISYSRRTAHLDAFFAKKFGKSSKRFQEAFGRLDKLAGFAVKTAQ